jgi:hypothetical protein
VRETGRESAERHGQLGVREPCHGAVPRDPPPRGHVVQVLTVERGRDLDEWGIRQARRVLLGSPGSQQRRGARRDAVERHRTGARHDVDNGELTGLAAAPQLDPPRFDVGAVATFDQQRGTAGASYVHDAILPRERIHYPRVTYAVVTWSP